MRYKRHLNQALVVFVVGDGVTGTKLTEYKVDEEAVASIATEVGVAKREAEIVRDFDLHEY